MNRKLTLSMDSGVVDFAHAFSRKINRPISQIIEHYFIELKERKASVLPKDLDEIYGIFEGLKAPDKKAMRIMFHEKNSN